MHTSLPNVPSMVSVCASGGGVVRSRSAQHIVQGLGRVLHNIMAGGCRPHQPLTFFGVVPWWQTNVTKQHVYACGGFLGV
jgi:hypothetical protein